MKLIELKCPNCNSKLYTKNDKSAMYCEYCGAQFIIDDEVKRSEHNRNVIITKREIDEGKIAEAQVEIERSKTERYVQTGFFVLIAFSLLFLLIIFYMSYGENEIGDYFSSFSYANVDEEDLIIMPGSSDSYKFNDVNEVEKELTEAGFTNISRVKDTFADSLDNLFASNGDVIKVKISGNDVKAGKKYKFNDEIIIYYYD